MDPHKANRLKDSASPYLRSAAHQPVDWHEWGEEAFAHARAEGKPILLDIGAVWCHWCHVIDRESYENPEIAAMINQFYMPVKVDRDERPDVDSRYQSAISAISGQGGWPLTAFLTPDGKPFFGGTYFPPEDAMGRPGFKRILLGIADAFKTRRAEVDSSAKALEEAVAKAEIFRTARGEFDAGVVDSVIESALHLFDETHGGFGNSPKFPHASAVDLLLERYQSSRDEKLLHVVKRTLEGMAQGGVYDQIGRRVSSLFGGRALVRAALRKNDVRQFRAAEKFSARLPGDGRAAFPRDGRRNYRVGRRSFVRPRARRILRQPGRRSDAR